MKVQRNIKDIIDFFKSWLHINTNGSKGKFTKDVAELLDISSMNMATLKKRNSIPYENILNFCSDNDVFSDDIFFENDNLQLVIQKASEPTIDNEPILKKSKEWELKYNELNEFCKVNNRTPLRTEKNAPEKQLAFWLKYQKELYADGFLDDYRTNKLLAIDKNIFLNRWDKSYKKFCAFIQINNSLPKYNAKEYDDEFKLYHWFLYQKKMYRNNNLSDYRIEKIKAIPNATIVSRIL